MPCGRCAPDCFILLWSEMQPLPALHSVAHGLVHQNAPQMLEPRRPPAPPSWGARNWLEKASLCKSSRVCNVEVGLPEGNSSTRMNQAKETLTRFTGRNLPFVGGLSVVLESWLWSGGHFQAERTTFENTTTFHRGVPLLDRAPTSMSAWWCRGFMQWVYTLRVRRSQEEKTRKIVADDVWSKLCGGIWLDLVHAGNTLYKGNRIRINYISW